VCGCTCQSLSPSWKLSVFSLCGQQGDGELLLAPQDRHFSHDEVASQWFERVHSEDVDWQLTPRVDAVTYLEGVRVAPAWVVGDHIGETSLLSRGPECDDARVVVVVNALLRDVLLDEVPPQAAIGRHGVKAASEEDSPISFPPHLFAGGERVITFAQVGHRVLGEANQALHKG
jgi:hypothetical protein